MEPFLFVYLVHSKRAFGNAPWDDEKSLFRKLLCTTYCRCFFYVVVLLSMLCSVLV